MVVQKAKGKETQYVLSRCNHDTMVNYIRKEMKLMRNEDAIKFSNGLRVVKEYECHPEDELISMRGLKHRRRTILTVYYKDIEREFVTGNYRVGF